MSTVTSRSHSGQWETIYVSLTWEPVAETRTSSAEFRARAVGGNAGYGCDWCTPLRDCDMDETVDSCMTNYDVDVIVRSYVTVALM